MADTFLYFLLLVVVYSGSTETYFLSDYLDTNLPDRLSDPVNENWQEKRSAESDYSSFSKNKIANNKGSTNFDYRNGNDETQVDDEIEAGDTFQKRESRIGSDYDERFSEAEIRKIFSQLSASDRQAFNGLMNDESLNIDVNKRQLLKQNFENKFHLSKRNNAKMCNGLQCDEYDQAARVNKQSISEEDSYDNCPEKVNSKRKSKFKRSHSFRSTPRENILQAKIDILKDNYKRSLEMRLLEDSAKRRYSKSKRKLDNDGQDR